MNIIKERNNVTQIELDLINGEIEVDEKADGHYIEIAGKGSASCKIRAIRKYKNGNICYDEIAELKQEQPINVKVFCNFIEVLDASGAGKIIIQGYKNA